ncbi:MAG: DinB family protein [Planctomycetota bacterium]
MDYSFLVETYSIERLKTLNVWSMFQDDDLDIRPHALLERDRTAHEHMVHQCLSEDKWFRTMFGIEVGVPPLPETETRLAFIRGYADDSGKRLARLTKKDEAWWKQEVAFFDTTHSRAWIMVRRIAHTAHHRGEQTTLLRLMGRAVYSVYGPSVDTGGLPINNALTINAYSDIPSLLEGEMQGGKKAALPGPGEHPSTERPDR